tara:strand:- start:33 stop:704 length:672 start_codon:yes stop_codon:yes gene_type:complete
MQTSESIIEIAQALVVAQGLIQNPAKASANEFFHSKYADLATVLDVVRPAFTSAGIAAIQTPSTASDGSIVVTTMLIHRSGEWIRDEIAMGISADAKNPAQAAGSLITYLRRYSLSAFANIAQQDDDGNGLEGNVKVMSKAKDDSEDYRAACDLLRDSIDQIIEGIEANNYQHAAPAWFELSEDEMKSIWRAPSKGGCFTTKQREVLKSSEFREAYTPKGKAA